jgi:hypothetical protein
LRRVRHEFKLSAAAVAVKRAAADPLQNSAFVLLFFSLAPGFSRVNRARRKWKQFQPFSAPAATKPLKRLGAASPAPTGLKPGANERLQESELRPLIILK